MAVVGSGRWVDGWVGDRLGIEHLGGSGSWTGIQVANVAFVTTRGVMYTVW